MTNFEPLIRGFLVEGSKVCLIGSEKDIHLNTVFKGEITNLTYDPFRGIIGYIKKNYRFNVLRIGHNIDVNLVFKYYYGLIEDNGIIIIDNSSGFDRTLMETCLGKFKLIYDSSEKLVLQKEPLKSDITFAIVIPTYYRKNGKTNGYIKRSLTSIQNQSYQNYKVFLMGDRYENKKEYESYRELLPEGKMEMVNLPIAFERDNCKTRENLWRVGGANAVNEGMNLAQKQSFKYYLHLDDDDYWHSFHLRNIAQAYEQFPEAVFVTTLGYCTNFGILPKTDVLDYNNFVCAGKQAYHSSYGFRLDMISFRYVTIDPKDPDKLCPMADADMLDRIGILCQWKGWKYLAVTLLTCLHDTEGELG